MLPLVNSTGDPANEYFSDGMSEEFISSLSRLQDLKVVGRTSSFQFKGTSDPSKTIGEKLGVYYLLEGSVRKSADRVRIAVALTKAGDGANVWSETYDRELKDIFAVQSEIAGAVAKELKVALLGNNGQSAQLTTAATPSNQNVEAYNALLQGNFYYNRRTVDDTRKAIGYYEEAIRLDPRYALAYAKLSGAAGTLASNFSGSITTREVQDAIAKARASAKRSLELDPNLADAHSAQGAILRNIDWNFVDAEAELRRALELAPQDSVTTTFAALMARLGRVDEAVALANGRLRSIRYAAKRTATSRSPLPRSAATTRRRRRCARPSNCSRRPPFTIRSLRIFRFCAANLERRWNSRKRKPIRSGAPTHWRWPTLPTATALRPTRP